MTTVKQKRPYVSFEEVKRRITFIEVAQALGIADRFRPVKPGHWKGTCPLPQHKHGPMPNANQFCVDRTAEGIEEWYCFGDCKTGGDIVRFAQLMLECEYAHTRFFFAEHWGDRLMIRMPPPEAAQKPDAAGPTDQSETAASVCRNTTPAPKPQGTGCDSCQHVNPPGAAFCNACGKTLSAGTLSDTSAGLKPLRFYLQLADDVPYLVERGVTKETQERYGLGLAQRGSLAGYIAMPIHYRLDGQWECVAYLGRLPTDDDRPRYKWPAGFPKERVLFGAKQAMGEAARVPFIVVTKGPFGVFHLDQAGIPHVVASLQCGVSEEQANLLAGFTDCVIVMYDGNDMGRAGQRQAVELLMERCAVRTVALPDGARPDRLAPEQLRQVLSFLL